jgi:hypothetical protein
VSRPSRRKRSPWPKRRQWMDRIACDHRLTAGAKSWLMLVANRSDNTGKPVWGSQVRMAAALGRCDRSVRRYLVEAVALGYVQVFRSKPQRGPDGRWSRRRSNSYYLCLPSRKTEEVAAPRRRQRVPYCTISSSKGARARRQAFRPAEDAPVQLAESVGMVEEQLHDEGIRTSADLADSNDLSTPLKGVRQPAAPPPCDFPSPSHTHLHGLAAARAALHRTSTSTAATT